MPDRPTTKDARRDAARERARQMRELEARKKRRNRVLAISAGVVAVVLVIGFVALAITRSGSSSAASSATPTGVTAAGAVVTGKGGAIVTGDAGTAHTTAIYLDYQCPYCKAFDSSVGPWLEQQRDAGVTTIEYHPIAFLDTSANQQYSTRSANAAFCVAGSSGADFTKFTDELYAQQPEEGTDGLTDSKLIGIAEDAGATGVSSCVADGSHEGFVKARTDNALAKAADGGVGITGTPTVMVDGKVVTGAQGGIPTQQDLATALGVTS